MARVHFLAGTVRGFFTLHHHVQTGSGAHPPSYPVDTGVHSPGVKWPQHESDHLPASSAEAKNVWSYTSTPMICLHGMVLS